MKSRRRGGPEKLGARLAVQGRLRFRCAPTVVLYWSSKKLIFENYLLRKKITADPVVCTILNYCQEWRSEAAVCSYLAAFQEAGVRRILETLRRNGILERSDKKADEREPALAGWRNWNPAASFFHFTTKDVVFATDTVAAFRDLQKQAKKKPMFPVGKQYPGARRVKLEVHGGESVFQRILRERRTWRRFSPTPVPIADLSRLLHLTFGVQDWARIPGVGRVAMKTSPSGGALHPIEAYVVAQKVAGLGSGIYYYDAKSHELVWLRKGISRGALEKLIGNQWWFGDAAFVVLLTAVFGRTQWKYDFPRAYRVVLLEAGHFGQTFCLTATWLGLAPFGTAALADTKWENLLGIDGVSESVLYALGAGCRPEEQSGAHLGKSAGACLPNWGLAPRLRGEN